jgi:hypothetical protein
MQAGILALVILLLIAIVGKGPNESKGPKITQLTEMKRLQEEKTNIPEDNEDDFADFLIYGSIIDISSI